MSTVWFSEGCSKVLSWQEPLRGRLSCLLLVVQIATIGLAASTDVVGVTLGGILGHAICTGAAVIGGRQLSAHIDERMLSILGGLLFIAFGLHAVWEVRTGLSSFCCSVHAEMPTAVSVHTALVASASCQHKLRAALHDSQLFCFAGCAGMSADAGWRLEGLLGILTLTYDKRRQCTCAHDQCCVGNCILTSRERRIKMCIAST